MFPSRTRTRTLRTTSTRPSPTFRSPWREEPPTSTASTSSPFQAWRTTWNIWGGRSPPRHKETRLLTLLTHCSLFLRPRRFTLKGYKRNYFVLRELQLTAYRTEQDSQDYSQAPSFTVNLKGCEVTPDVNIANKKYGIKLAVPSAEGMSDLWLRCESVSWKSQKNVASLIADVCMFVL